MAEKLTLDNLPKRATNKGKRKGRGNAGTGTYAGRGLKGQRSRSGGRQGIAKRSLKHLILRVPKQRGFKSLQIPVQTITLSSLAKHATPAEQNITPAIMKRWGIIKSSRKRIRVVGSGKLKKALRVQAHGFSETAATAIVQAGGSTVILKRKIKLPKSQQPKA